MKGRNPWKLACLMVCTAVVALMLPACPSSRKVTRIHMDMTFDALVERVGQPDMKTQMDSVTTVYYYTKWQGEPRDGPAQYYCVTVTAGRVARHGVCPAAK